MNHRNAYQPPQVLRHEPIRFETAQSWNRGRGNLDHPGTGNGGVNYPLPPYTGPRKDKFKNGVQGGR